MVRPDPDVTSPWQRIQHVPGPLLDVGLALMVAVTVLIAIGVAPQPGRQPDALAYLLGLTIAALGLVRRRWPVAVLVASAATLQLYYLLDYVGIRPAVPLAVALATAWAAGHPRWSLLVAVWFTGAPLLVRTLVESEALQHVLDDSVPDMVLFGAVLLLGEAGRNRRALDLERDKSERLLLNVLPASIAARLKQTEAVIADGFPEVTVLFADLVDFTRRSERIRPEQLAPTNKALTGGNAGQFAVRAYFQGLFTGCRAFPTLNLPVQAPARRRPAQPLLRAAALEQFRSALP